jgi:hypothetical protein
MRSGSQHGKQEALCLRVMLIKFDLILFGKFLSLSERYGYFIINIKSLFDLCIYVLVNGDFTKQVYVIGLCLRCRNSSLDLLT